MCVPHADSSCWSDDEEEDSFVLGITPNCNASYEQISVMIGGQTYIYIYIKVRQLYCEWVQMIS